ncbi:MAG: phosphopantothenoylcysteine decarboxylase [Phycisphaerales bacterium]|nr:phosphopantothenoylcysteine decarboxylase [Phycisphaerales bacterium]MCB9837270.1 phosphopantothenoylcysteine decarboxylase [Phycisphaera sp.]
MTTKKPPHPFPRGTETPRLLITAGPTHEPIDAVRYLGNRSSGRLGIELADHAAKLGWPAHLLLGPTYLLLPQNDQTQLTRFGSTANLASALNSTLPECDILIMAAAVADYTPAHPELETKIRRSENTPLTIELTPTPDLLAACSKAARPDQLLVGFALEPAEGLREAAASKLRRKGVDLIVANPLETMEASEIEASLIASEPLHQFEQQSGRLSKAEFAAWLLPILHDAWRAKCARTPSTSTDA